MKLKGITYKVIIALLLTISVVTVSATYIPTNRDTSEPPEYVVYDFEAPDPEEYASLGSFGDLDYYFRESRGTVMIYDNRNDYVWKTGLDLEFSKDIDDECDDAIDLYEEQHTELDPSIFGFTTSINPNLTDSSIEGNNGTLKISTSGLNDTNSQADISTIYTGLTLTQGKLYQVSFDARSLMEREIVVNLNGYVNEIVSLTTEETTYTYTFTMNDATITNGLLQFDFGFLADMANPATTIYLDNILVEEFDGTNIVDETNQITRGDFELLDTELTYTDEDILAACRPKEVKLNTTYTGFANSILTIEYYDDANNIKRVSSSSHVNVDMDFKTTNDNDHFVFEIDFKKQDIEVVLHMYLDETGLRFEVLDQEVTGDGVGRLAAIIIAPFMGASGGAYEEFDLTEMDYADDETFKYKVPGYALVPDGSGTLIRFNDNNVKLDFYESAIYGANPGQDDHYFNDEGWGYVPFKTSSMPVFGIAHGNLQAAFVAFATEGDEYMQIVSMPEENLTYYNFTYPRFEYNKQYFQVYNKSGWGYLTLYEDRNHFDININYNILSGDGTDGPSADYVGMAQSYREHLIDQGLLNEITNSYDDIPIRLDFLMSDVEKGITGYDNQVTTTISGVDRVLAQIMENEITNINTGLLGWNDGGITLGDPSETDFARSIGRERDFRSVITKYNELGVDISPIQDYYIIYEEMMSLRNNASRHTSTWYARYDTQDIPLNMEYYARPSKSISWLHNQADDFNDLGVESYSIYGITNNLTSDYTNNTLRTEAKNIVIDGFGELDEDKLVNAYQPNSYLWAYTDRYLQTPVYGTQFLIETDTVPFLQLVLQGTMEMYAPYANFSFYTDKDILRMIDYNVYPSFVLTEEPAHLLTDTLSRTYYSTEYNLYEELIQEIYGEVNGALSSTINATWTNRTVLENGVIENTYSNGVVIIINYKEEAYDYNGSEVLPESYIVIGG